MPNVFSAASSQLASPVTWVMLFWGLVVGSFLNVCIYRIPRHIFWKSARSHCPHCGALIPAWCNIPVLSFLILRGRARCCRAKISWQYPIVEFLTALIFVGTYWHFPFLDAAGQFTAFDPGNFIRFSHALVFTCLMLVCSVIDIQHQIIPDVISLPMVAATPLVVAIHPELGWQSALYGVVVGAGAFYALAWAYYLVRKESGLGMGDVKLLAAIGGWLGVQAILPTVFFGSITGALFGIGAIIAVRSMTMKTALPFGPFLALGACLHLYYGGKLWEWFF